LGWINPKPFWLLNHFTVPVVIVFSKAQARTPRDNHAIKFNFVDVFGKGARRRIQQGTAADRTKSIYTTLAALQGVQPFNRVLHPVENAVRSDDQRPGHAVCEPSYANMSSEAADCRPFQAKLEGAEIVQNRLASRIGHVVGLCWVRFARLI
jgi:hypothetical protein